ncbi:MAG: hypothetical protein SFZ23_05100 [Planctomycetota bacterium]|nr:hypothetical protein [Planctomycetota bacterium]
MSEKEAAGAKSEGDAAPASDAPPKKKPPIKVIGIVAALMIIEGVAVFVLVGSGGKPPKAEAKHVEGDHAGKEDLDALVELQLVKEKFQNMQTGRVWIWDVEIYLKVKKKNEEAVQKELEARQAEVTEAVATMFRRAQHAQLKEPGLETLTRQLTQFVSKTFKPDADGKPRVERVIIPKCKGFAAD